MAIYQIIQSHGKVFDFIRAHKAGIFTYGGIGLMTASTIAACIGTKNMIEEKEEVAKEPSTVKRAVAKGKHFVIAGVFYAGGVVSIHKGHRILKAENAALTQTIATMAAGTMAYRNRWKNKVGEEEEEKIFFDEKTEEVTDENGKKKKVKTQTIDQSISTDIYFDRYCSWRADDHGDISFDKQIVRNVQAELNNELRGNPEQIVFLEHAYDMLGAFVVNEHGQRVDYRTIESRVAGWIYDKKNPTGDNTIVLKITETTRKLEDGRIIPTLRISFNHDGGILKAAKERGLLK